MPSDRCYHKNSSRNCTVKATKSGQTASPRAAAVPAAEKSDLSLIDSQVVKTTPIVMNKCQAVIIGPQDHDIELIVAILEIVNTPPRRHIPVGSQGSCRGRAGSKTAATAPAARIGKRYFGGCSSVDVQMARARARACARWVPASENRWATAGAHEAQRGSRQRRCCQAQQPSRPAAQRSESAREHCRDCRL